MEGIFVKNGQIKGSFYISGPHEKKKKIYRNGEKLRKEDDLQIIAVIILFSSSFFSSKNSNMNVDLFNPSFYLCHENIATGYLSNSSTKREACLWGEKKHILRQIT